MASRLSGIPTRSPDSKPSSGMQREGRRMFSGSSLTTRTGGRLGSRSSPRLHADGDRGSKENIATSPDKDSQMREALKKHILESNTRPMDDEDGGRPSSRASMVSESSEVAALTSKGQSLDVPSLDIVTSTSRSRSHTPERSLFTRTPRSSTPNSETQPSWRLTPRKTTPSVGSRVSPELRSFFIEKEVLESQLRKLQVENGSLTTENKLLKDKYNRAQNTISDLQNKLSDLQEDYDTLLDSKDTAVSAIKRKTRAVSESDRLELHQKIDSLTKENNNLKSEIDSLESRLTSARRTTDVYKSTSGQSEVVEAYRKETDSLKEELKRVKMLLDEGEKYRLNETKRKKEESSKIVKLTEMKNLLQQQVELGGAGGTVAEKQVRSLEARLKVTEERLHSERADRAGKLSEVEDKLINENAKLQFSEREARRQLQREKDKVRNLDNKLRDLREGKEPSQVDSRESTSSHDRQNLSQMKEQIADFDEQRKGLEATFKQQIKQVVDEKHTTIAKLQSLDDTLAGLKAENDSLKQSLIESGVKDSSSVSATPRHFEAQVETLKIDIDIKNEEIQQHVRKIELLESEIGTVRSQLRVTEKSLEEAKKETRRLSHTRSNDDDSAELKQHKIDKLSHEVQQLQSEQQTMQEKYNILSVDKMQLEDHVSELETKARLNRSRRSTDGRFNESLESEKLTLENELGEKESQIIRLTSQYNQSEDELQRTRQGLILEQEQTTQLASQMEDLQGSVLGKTRQIEELSDNNRRQRIELDSLKEHFDHTDRDLTSKTAEVKMLSIEVSRGKSKCDHLSKQLEKKYLGDEKGSGTLVEKQRKIKLLEVQNENLQHEITKATAVLEGILKENSNLLRDIRHLNQAKLTDTAMIQELSRERDEDKERSQFATEEKETLEVVNQQLEIDISKRETDIHGLNIRLGEDLSHKMSSPSHDGYKELNVAGRRIANELETMRKLLEAREKEIDLLQDSLNRQKLDGDALNRRLILLHEENERRKGKIEKMNGEVNNKLREITSNHEANQTLNHEKNELHVEILKLQKDLNREKENVEARRLEVAEMQKRLESFDDSHKSTDRLLHKTENQLAITETELHHTKQTITQLEGEIREHKSKINKLTREKISLEEINVTLDKRLHSEKNTLTEQKMSSNHYKQESDRTQKQLDKAKHDHDVLVISLETEKKMAETLKEKLQKEEETRHKMDNQIRSLQFEVDSLNAKQGSSKENLKSMREDKQKLYSEIEEISQKISKKDDLISQLQMKCSETVGKVNTEYALVNQQKDTVEEELLLAKKEINDLNEEIKKRDSELTSFDKTQQELSHEKRWREESKVNLEKLEKENERNRLEISDLKTELVTFTESNKYMKENVDELKVKNAALNEENAGQKATLATQIENLRDMMAENNSKNESEKLELRDKLNRTLADMKSMEVSLNTTSETKDHFHNSNKYLEKTIDTLKSQLHEEITSRKMSDDRLQTMKQQLEELKRKKITTDEKLEDLAAQVTKLSADLQFERGKVEKLKTEYNELEVTSYAHEARGHTLQEQNDGVQMELELLKQKFDSQKQHLTNKNKRTSLELKQYSETQDKEKNKMNLEIQQLTIQLKQARDQLTSKNQEVVKLNEQICHLEEKTRDASSQLFQTQNTLKGEQAMQDKMSNRNQELELEVIELKGQMSRKFMDDQPREKDSNIRTEMTRMLQEIQFQMLLNNKGNNINDNRMDHTQLFRMLEDSRDKVGTLQSELSTEKAMHEITKNQLKFMEEDNEKLREQIKKLRAKKNTPERPIKSRMEEINERIARSQMYAQSMLMTGASMMNEDALKSCTIPPDYNLANTLLTTIGSPIPRPNSVLGNESHDSLNSTFQDHQSMINNMMTLNNTTGFRPFNGYK